ncbi:hypothetical protein KFJ24_14685 [Marinobacter sediminum]|uniref:hypothetical protein n=1 Tax=Marinobacter sediminum TaxID=256323 RepID=UPI00202DBD97|nr:hypothetical protein [Marinobacter sediminum]MCM0613729.1 hypothetical protein [Marinobacter sediminum]
MNATEDEQHQLEMLVSKYDQHRALRGELVFGAIDDEGRLDVATPFFDEADYAEFKSSGLRDALIGLLDDMMIGRSKQGVGCAHDGILRLSSSKTALEWLPEGASRDAADARRADWNLIPWLIEQLDLIQHATIEWKKARSAEKNDGDTARWKKEIWRSPDKNHAIKSVLAAEGQRLGFQVLPAGSRGEWLYDLVWRRLDANRNLTCMPLAVEIEMSDSSLGGIRYDFNKLLQAHANHKLMVFQVKTEGEVESTFERLEESIQVYPHSASCRYLLCGWNTQQNAFSFKTREVASI